MIDEEFSNLEKKSSSIVADYQKSRIVQQLFSKNFSKLDDIKVIDK
jgi:hypothetical protein